MKKIIFSLLSVSFFLFSCGESAIEVNKEIVLQVEKVNVLMSEVTQHISADEYDLAKSKIDSLTAQVASSEEALKTITYSKAGVYKQSAIDYVAFIGKDAPGKLGKAIEIFEAAKLREQADVASGKQSATMINSGPDFDEARNLLKDFRKDLKKVHEVLADKQEKFLTANGIK